MEKAKLKRWIDAAAGRIPCDLLIKNVQLVNVYTGQIRKTDIAVFDGVVVGLDGNYNARETVDASGLYASPGLIDSHIHIESSYVTPEEISRLAVPCGTTTIVADPHEIVNVGGLTAWKYMLEAAKNAALDIKYMVPSCVPATPFEHSGAVLMASQMDEPLKEALGLGEFMNYPGVIAGADLDIDKILAAKAQDKPIDGHSPLVEGNLLNAYLVTGIHTDHECASPEEALERVERGMYVMLRQGSACHNLCTNLKAVTKDNSRRFILCSDDRQARTLIEIGHLNNHLKMCVEEGIDAVTAIRMATLNAAECYDMKDRGAIAPGLRADIVLFEDLTEFHVKKVYIEGKLTAEEGRYLPEVMRIPIDPVRNSFHVAPFTQEDLKLHLTSDKVNTIGVLPGGVVTEKKVSTVKRTSDGDFLYDPEKDIVKVCVVERHHATGGIGVGLLENYGLKRGAIALSIAHDSHNIIVAGTSNEEIEFAIRSLCQQEGGIVITCEGKILDSLPLPVGGLMSDQSGEWVAEHLKHVHETAFRELGIHESVEPVMTLCFMALPVIPEIKLTDMGLFDVIKFAFLDPNAE
ncbi:MAG: adenine deaminase [Firmicutes bacterium]|nr:adenine deaminase [Bacillota bacterium]